MELYARTQEVTVKHSNYGEVTPDLMQDEHWRSQASDIRQQFEMAAQAFADIDVPDSEPELARIIGELGEAVTATGQLYVQGARTQDLDLMDEVISEIPSIGALALEMLALLVDYCGEESILDP